MELYEFIKDFSVLIISLVSIGVSYIIFQTQLVIIQEQMKFIKLETLRIERETIPRFSVSNFNTQSHTFVLDLKNISKISSANDITAISLTEGWGINLENNYNDIISNVSPEESIRISFQVCRNINKLEIELNFFDDEGIKYRQFIIYNVGSRKPHIKKIVQV